MNLKTRMDATKCKKFPPKNENSDLTLQEIQTKVTIPKNSLQKSNDSEFM